MTELGRAYGGALYALAEDEQLENELLAQMGERACLANVSGTTECIFRLMFLKREHGAFSFSPLPRFPATKPIDRA